MENTNDLTVKKPSEIVSDIGDLSKYLDNIDYEYNNSIVNKENLVESFCSISQHLSEDDLILILKEAKKRARVSLFLERIKVLDNKPIKYENSPRTLRLPDFIKREWVEKGLNPQEIDRKLLSSYDDKLVRAIENYEYNNGLLDDKFRFPKVGSRKSKKEMTPSP